MVEVVGAPFNYDQNLIAGDAGETVAAGEVVYLKEADGEWYKADASTSATCEDVALGIAQGAGTDGAAITGGVLVGGLDKNATYTAGSKYYVSDTAGALATSAGTVEVLLGVGDANNSLVWQHTNTLESLAADEKDLVAAITANATEINQLDGATITAAQLTEAGTFFGATDISGAEAETLTDGSNADALHVHAARSYASGVSTHDISTTTTLTIAHTLGATPGLVRVDLLYKTIGNTTDSFGSYEYDGTTFTALFGDTTNATSTLSNTSTSLFRFGTDGSNFNEGTVAVDGTNITTTWSKTGSPTGTILLRWSAWTVA